MSLLPDCMRILQCAALLLSCTQGAAAAAADPRRLEFDGERAMRHVHAQMPWAPRSVGAPGHERTRNYIESALRSDALSITVQTWTEPRADGAVLTLTNIIGRLQPLKQSRLLLGTHYDAIVRAYRDPDPALRNEPMPGANNSASGVALLLEAAHALSAAGASAPAVDFVFFDGEEGPYSLGAGDPQWRALGSPHFAAHIREIYPGALPALALIYDMVCKRGLHLAPEASSLRAAPREIDAVWGLGRTLAPKVFASGPAIGPIGDDQAALAALGIPSLLLIDFDYEPWFNTTHDTEDKCAAESLQAVGTVTVAFARQRN